MRFKIEHLEKHFEKKEVLRDIDFTFESGKIYGLLGRNGAGKTTLFNCLNKDMKVDGGMFYLEEGGQKREMVPDDIGYVLSTPTVPEFLTGREFLKFFIDIHEDMIEEPRDLDAYFDYMSIALEDRDKLLKDYSHGMKNKMQMLVNIIAKPKLLLLDEPLTSLDVVVAEEMKQILRSLKKDRIIIVSTHIMDLALDLCDEIVLLNHGVLDKVDKTDMDSHEFKEKILAVLRDERPIEGVSYMNKTFKIAYALKNTYRVNTILYSLKQIPVIKKLFPQELYRDPDYKIFANIMSGIWEFIKAFLGKFLYFLLMIALIAGLYKTVPERQTFLHIFVILTLIGAPTNTYIFNPTKDKYYALILLRMDAREYALSTYGYEMMKILAGYLVFGMIFGKMRGLATWQCVLLPFAAAGMKLAVVAWSLRKYERTGYAVSENQIGAAGWIMIVLALAAAYGFPAAAVLNVPVIGNCVLPEMVSVSILVCGILCGILSLRKIWTFTEFREVYQQILTQYLHQVEEAKSSVKSQSEKVIQMEEDTGSSRKGFEYLNELFIRRHQKILWKSSKRIAVISLGVVLAGTLGLFLFPEFKGKVNHLVLTNLPYFVFIMYCINRGTGFTNVLFMNCDHSLLTYSFYKRPECILRLFWIRLREIMKVNLLPAFVIGTGLAALLYLSGGTEDPMNYVMLLVSILCMSAFFSMHYLTIYYLLQPYNAGTEIKSGTYRIVVVATYLFCYGFMQLRMSTFVFGLGTIIFCMVYCAAACVLIYRLAPRTFRLRA